MEKKENEAAVQLLYDLLEFGKAIAGCIDGGPISISADRQQDDAVELTADTETRQRLGEHFKSIGVTHKQLARQMGVRVSVVKKMLGINTKTD